MYNQLRIIQFNAFETGTYNDMYGRPYQSQINNEITARYMNSTQGGRVISPSTMSMVAGSILRPSTIVDREIQIANGWATKRFRFIMVVEETITMGGKFIYVITGYTDNNNASIATASIDPNMVLYFNNVVTVNATVDHSPGGGMRSFNRIVDTAHLVNIPVGIAANRGYNITSGPLTMRPEDVVDQLTANYMGLDGETTTLRNGFATENLVRSQRSNAIPTNYMSKTLKALVNSTHESTTAEGGFSSICDNARGYVQEELPIQNTFLKRLILETEMKHSGSISYGQLASLHPEVDIIGDWKLHDFQGNDSFVANRGSTSYWNESVAELPIATMLGNTVPSLMVGMMLGRAVFSITNMTLSSDEPWNIMIHSVAGLVKGMNIDLMPYIEHLKSRLIIEVLNSVSEYGRIPLSVNMRVDVMGDMFMSISFNGRPPVDFNIPTFADHLLTPILTTNRTNLEAIASDFEKIASNTPTIFGGTPIQYEQQPRNATQTATPKFGI